MSIARRAAPGPAPAAQARLIVSASTRSSWRTWPKVKARRKVPRVEGAIALWPSSASLAPLRSTSASSIESAPATIAWISVSTLRPGRVAPARSPSRTVLSTRDSIPRRLLSVATISSPALATRRSSSNSTPTESGRTSSAKTFTMWVTS